MTNHYQPTRADQLQPGDVVRTFKGEHKIGVIVSRGKIINLTSSAGVWIGTYILDDLLDKRISDEEYEALSAPGDWL